MQRKKSRKERLIKLQAWVGFESMGSFQLSELASQTGRSVNGVYRFGGLIL